MKVENNLIYFVVSYPSFVSSASAKKLSINSYIFASSIVYYMETGLFCKMQTRVY